jgi:hypothetical protein
VCATELAKGKLVNIYLNATHNHVSFQGISICFRTGRYNSSILVSETVTQAGNRRVLYCKEHVYGYMG